MTESSYPPIRFQPRRVGHVNFFMRDFLEEMDFFMRVCGFEESGRESNVRSGFLTNGNTHHDIGFIDLPGWKKHSTSKVVEGPEGRGTKVSLNHFGFEMYNEVDLVEAYKRALEHGMQPRITHNGTSKSNYIFDPWGNQYQLYADELLDWRQVFVGGESEFHANPPWDPLAGEPDPKPYWDPNPKISWVDGPPLHPMRVTHAVMQNPDVEAYREWCEQVLGLRTVAHVPGKLAYLAGTASRYDIVIVPLEEGEEQGMHHASFELWPTQDLDDAEKRLNEMGVDGVQRIDMPHKRSIFLVNPSGITMEFYIQRNHPDAAAIADGSEGWRYRV